jgi:SAM-dependent methyltransferase
VRAGAPIQLLRRGLTPANLSERLHDAAIGVRTVGFAELRDLGVADEHRVFYSPLDWRSLNRAIGAVAVGEDDVFMDLGAGMGRAVIAAARRPFRGVVGVELAPELAETARANVERARGLRCRDVTVEVADATEWDPPDDVTVAYAYNPFTGPVFAAAVERLLASLDRRPRPLLFVYAMPFEHNFLLSTGRFRPIDTRPARWPERGIGPGERVVSYAVRAQDGDFTDAGDLMVEPRVREERWLGPTETGVRLNERLAGERPLVSPAASTPLHPPAGAVSTDGK